MTEEATPKGKNKKMYIMAGATAVLCIILLVVSSSLKKGKSKPASVNQEQTTVQATPQEEEPVREQNLSEFWDEIDRSNQIVKPKENVSNVVSTLNKLGYISDEDAQTTIDEPVRSYPPPSFVSSSGDTLVWGNGIYQRIETLPEPELKPDTLILNGKTYIELLDESK